MGNSREGWEELLAQKNASMRSGARARARGKKRSPSSRAAISEIANDGAPCAVVQQMEARGAARSTGAAPPRHVPRMVSAAEL